MRDQLNELRQQSESEWLEFKHNNKKPETVGELISALSNGAALNGKPYGWIVWGIEDSSRELIGTNFDPTTDKKGNDDLTSWLEKYLTPSLHI